VPALHAQQANGKLSNEVTLIDCGSHKHLCSHHGKPIFLNAGHHVRAKTNSPIIGILTQPMPVEWYSHKQLKKTSNSYYTKFVESSNVEFLMAGGARVVPIDY
jgi:hypothetical protein